MRLRRPTFSALRRFDGKKLIRSLSFRLMLFFVLVSGGVLGAAGYISYKETLENIDEFFDTYQMALGRLLAAADWSSVSQHTQKVTDRLIEGIENADDDDDAVGFAVFTPQGDMIFHDNENGKYIHFSDNIGSFSNEHIRGEDDPWRLVRLKSADGKYLIAVGQEIEYREDLAMDIVEEFMLPWVTGFAFLLLAIVGLTYIEFRPLKKLARQIKRRQADDLTPISTEKAPVEVLPLLKAMNHIFGKIEALLGRERSFISDSAHELRTPLTALKIQLEIAQMAKDDEQLHTQTLDKLAKGLERAEHLVEQLLALSRLEANNGHYDNQEILNWPDIIQQLIDEYTPNAAKKDIRFIKRISSGQAPFSTGNHILAAMLLRNLIDNAVKYSPTGATVTILTGDGELAVINSGAKVDEPVLQRLSERFFRPAGQKETGSGLGLAIVERIAGIYNCRLSFANTAEGFKATIHKS